MKDLNIRKAAENDLPQLLELYTHLHNNQLPAVDERVESIWSRIMADTNHHILLGCADSILVSSCVVVVIENLTQNQMPYAVIENVITCPDYRNRGYASL